MTTMAESATQPSTELTASDNLGSDVWKAFGKMACMDAVMCRLKYQSSTSNTRARLVSTDNHNNTFIVKHLQEAVV